MCRIPKELPTRTSSSTGTLPPSMIPPSALQLPPETGNFKNQNQSEFDATPPPPFGFDDRSGGLSIMAPKCCEASPRTPEDLSFSLATMSFLQVNDDNTNSSSSSSSSVMSPSFSSSTSSNSGCSSATSEALSTIASNLDSASPTSIFLNEKQRKLRFSSSSSSSNSPPYHYKMGPLLREGGYGEIRFAMKVNEENNEEEMPVAIKVFQLEKVQNYMRNRKSPSPSSLSSSSFENPLKEILIQQQFLEIDEESHLVTILDILQTNHAIYVILPFYSGGDLLDVLETNDLGRLTVYQAKEMFFQITLGLKCLHQKYGIVHRDLSIENIFYSKEKNLYAIGDFGLSLKLAKEKYDTNTTNRSFQVSSAGLTICGKEGYIAPELWALSTISEINLFAVDVWALGIILFMAITGSSPLKRAVESDPYYQILCLERRLFDLIGDVNAFLTTQTTEEMAEEQSELIQGLSLVQEILNPNPLERPTIDEILSNEWFRRV